MELKIFTRNYVSRMAAANAVCRVLRRAGYRVLSCVVAPGDSIEKPQIEVAGGGASHFPPINDCVVTRRLGRLGARP